MCEAEVAPPSIYGDHIGHGSAPVGIVVMSTPAYLEEAPSSGGAGWRAE
jgi:hypothetical protein